MTPSSVKDDPDQQRTEDFGNRLNRAQAVDVVVDPLAFLQADLIHFLKPFRARFQQLCVFVGYLRGQSRIGIRHVGLQIPPVFRCSVGRPFDPIVGANRQQAAAFQPFYCSPHRLQPPLRFVITPLTGSSHTLLKFSVSNALPFLCVGFTTLPLGITGRTSLFYGFTPLLCFGLAAFLRDFPTALPVRLFLRSTMRGCRMTTAFFFPKPPLFVP